FMSIISLLKASEDERRRYKTETDYLSEVFRFIELMTGIAGTDRWTSLVGIIKAIEAGDSEDEFEIQNLLLWKSVDISILTEFCPDLPKDFLDFYSSLTCGLL